MGGAGTPDGITATVETARYGAVAVTVTNWRTTKLSRHRWCGGKVTTDFGSVIKAWREADPSKIHPTREHESEAAYWESGKPQAETVFNLVGPGGEVLDFGCGDGRIAIPMAQLGLVVYACDAAPEMIERLGANAKRLNLGWKAAGLRVTDPTEITAFVSDGTDLPAPLIVDAVNARAVFIHHAHADVAVLVHNLAACIRPGGFLVADWPLGPHHERRDWIDVTTWDYDLRHAVAEPEGLELVSEGEPGKRPSVWVKH